MGTTRDRERLLTARRERPTATIRELAKLTKIPRATAHRWLTEAAAKAASVEPPATESQDPEVLGGPVTPDAPDPAAAIREGLRWAVGPTGVPEALRGPFPLRTSPDPFAVRDRRRPLW